MESFNHNLKLYIATHSYGPLVLWPWGFQFNLPVANWREHDALGNAFVDAARAAGNEDDWEVGNGADVLYISFGASDDFAMAYGKAKLGYTIELPSAGHGFEYPQDMIERLVKEMFMGYRAMGLYIGDRYHRVDN